MIDDFLLHKIKDAFKYHFIGDVIFDDEQISIMTEYIRHEWLIDNFKFKQHDETYFEILFVLVIQYAKKWGLDDNDDDKYFFKSIFKKILNEPNISTLPNDLTKYCEDKNHRPFGWLFDFKHHTHRYKQTVLYNALAPKTDMFDFFEVIRGAYNDEKNIESGYFDLPYESDNYSYDIFVKKYALRLEKISEDEETVDLYGGSYKLATFLRNAFKWDQVGIAMLISKVICYFKDFFVVDDIFDNTYLSKLVKEYLTNNKKQLAKFNPKSHVEKVNSVSSWYAYYDLDIEKDSLNLCMPLLKVGEEAGFEHLSLELYLDDAKEPILQRDIAVTGLDYNRHINKIEIPLLNIIPKCEDNFNFKILIYNGKNIYFDSKTSLYRKFILFKTIKHRENTESVIPVTSDNKWLLVTTKCHLEALQRGISKTIEKTNYHQNLYFLDITENDYILYDDREIYFGSKESFKKVVIDGHQKSEFSFKHRSETYPVYKKIKSIQFKIPSDGFNGKKLCFKHTFIDDNDLATTKYIPINESFIKFNNIVLDTDIENSLSANGCHKINLEDNSGDVLSSCTYYMFSFRLLLSSGKMTQNGYFKVEIDIDDVITNHYCSSQDEKSYIEYKNGFFQVIVPYLKYKLEGTCGKEDFNYVIPNAQGQNIYTKNLYTPKIGSGDVLDLENTQLKIITNINNFDVLVDDEIVSAVNGSYYIGQKIKNCYGKVTVKVRFFNEEYCLYECYTNPTLEKDNLVIDYNGDGNFHYKILNFIGPKEQLFELILESEYGDEHSILLDCLEGDFKISDFEEGSYDASLYLSEIEFNGQEYVNARSALLCSCDSLIFGDIYLHYYDDSYIKITKISKFGKLKDTFIKNIKLLEYDGLGFPIFVGRLFGCGIGGKFVYFSYKDDIGKYLIPSFDKEFNEPLFYDVKQKKILSRKTNEDCHEIKSLECEEI